MFISTELSLITLHWFLTSFASVVHIKLLLRIWDLFFYHGSLVLFQVTLGMLSMKVTTLSSASINIPTWPPSKKQKGTKVENSLGLVWVLPPVAGRSKQIW